MLTTLLHHFATDCTALARAFQGYVDQGRAQEAAGAAEELEALLPRLGLGPAGPEDGTTYCNTLQVDRDAPAGTLPLNFRVVRTAAAGQGACCHAWSMHIVLLSQSGLLCTLTAWPLLSHPDLWAVTSSSPSYAHTRHRV